MKTNTSKSNSTKIIGLVTVVLFSSVSFSKVDCGIRKSTISEMSKLKLTYRSFSGWGRVDDEQVRKESLFETYNVNGKSTIIKLSDEEVKNFSGQCKVYVRPFDEKNGHNYVEEEKLFNPELYSLYNGSATLFIDSTNKNLRLLTNTHVVRQFSIKSKDNKWSDASQPTKVGDIVLTKCGGKTFFARVKSHRQEFEVGEMPNTSNDIARLEPVDTNGKVNLNYYKGLKPVEMLIMGEKESENVSGLIETSNSNGFVLQTQGGYLQGNKGLDSDNFYRSKIVCRANTKSYIKADLFNNYKMDDLALVCDGPVRMSSGSPLYLSKADRSGLEQYDDSAKNYVVAGLVQSGDLFVDKIDGKLKTFIHATVVRPSDLN